MYINWTHTTFVRIAFNSVVRRNGALANNWVHCSAASPTLLHGKHSLPVLLEAVDSWIKDRKTMRVQCNVCITDAVQLQQLDSFKSVPNQTRKTQKANVSGAERHPRRKTGKLKYNLDTPSRIECVVLTESCSLLVQSRALK